ncbi:MAG TPA: prolipoprotein diacylglyceryl transferase, partial [Bacillota bacterium]|nr:prolipoprotein diacylglyceryl transferase [Bacillota bacterium]
MSDYLVDFPGLGIFDIPINRTIVEFDIFGRHFSIYWYGVLIAIAFLLCIYLSMRHAPKFGMSQDQIADYYLLIIPLALVGARIYYVVFEWDTYKGDLMRILDLRSGGLAFYGGVIGGALAIMIMAAFKKHKFSRIFDFIAVYLPLGHAIGRWGNFFNQEAFGVNTDLPWGMYSNGTQEYLSSLSVGQRRMLPNLDVT